MQRGWLFERRWPRSAAPQWWVGALTGLLLIGCGADERRCKGPADCALPETCGSDRRCALPEPVALGVSCGHPTHCLSGSCIDWGEGAVCAQPCDEAGACAANDVCVPRPGRAPSEAAATLRLRCLPPPSAAERFLTEACADDSACRSGLCQAGSCSQPCGSCPALTACDGAELQREGLLLNHALCLPEPALRVLELGPLVTPVTGAPPLRFEVGADAVSLIIFAEDSDGLRVALRRLVAPDGTVLVDSDDPSAAPLRASAYIGTATLLLPGSDDPRAALQVGSYELTVGTYEPARFDALVPVEGALERIAVVTRRRAGGGLLDLNLHVTPGTGLTAATAPESDYAQGVLARVDSLFRQRFGVALGEVRWADLPASADAVPDGNQARALVSSAAVDSGSHGSAANVFFVKTLGFAAGFAGVVPGVPGLLKRPASGVVLARSADVQTMGALMAHELGHFLGLWHTSDPEGSGANDPISDTPACAAGSATASCPDRSNLMFPSFVVRGALAISSGQAAVLRSSPWLYELAYPDVCGSGLPAVDITGQGFASGSSAEGGAGLLAGVCGGAQQPERVHLLRLPAQVGALEIEVLAQGFAPVVYVRRDPCADASQELACAVGLADQALKLSLPLAAAGTYYLVVDGVAGGGRYALSVQTQPLAPPS
ncbi:MAG: hypothetical protein IPL40_08940 [Proteobacteria bacterium]|nr:hypothetical protein [Pseudomonadota bacterium]